MVNECLVDTPPLSFNSRWESPVRLVAASAVASMRTVVVHFANAAADAAAYYIATAGFIGVSRRTGRSDTVSDAASL